MLLTTVTGHRGRMVMAVISAAFWGALGFLEYTNDVVSTSPFIAYAVVCALFVVGVLQGSASSSK